MEQFNYRDDFEQFLRNCTDDFIMIPARKVWYGIYNDMHPAKRWPSLAIALVMLFSILFVGVSNNNALNKTSFQKEKVFASNLTIESKNESQVLEQTKKDFVQLNEKLSSESIKKSAKPIYTTLYNTKVDDQIARVNNISNESITSNKTLNKSNKKIVKASKNYSSLKISNATNDDKELVNEDNILPNDNLQTIASIIGDVTKTSLVIADVKKINNKVTENYNLNEEKAWKEDYALKNKPKLYLKKPNKTLTYYITPSYGFRTLEKTQQDKISSSALMQRSSIIEEKETNNDKAAINMEAGVELRFPISKNVFFKTGAQFNYTNYVTQATDIGHTTEVTMATAGNLNFVKASSYTTEKGKTNLNNTTLQISIPVGLDVMVAKAGKINWYVSAALQPSFTFGGSAFLLSSDERNYISDHTMLRKWNVNTAIETFITYKATPEIMVHFGPQLRYQLLSTYKNLYNYKENLYNFGLKIGVTKTF
jgi:hypothetical protein